MKKLKKALSLSLVLALSLSLAVPVSAADDFGPYSVNDVDSTWSFSSAKVETRDIKLEEGELYPNETFILVQPNSTITYSGYIGSIELYTKIGDYYSALGESRNLSQSEPDMTDTINVNDLFSCEVDLGQIILWTSDSFKEIFIILDDGNTTEPEQPAKPAIEVEKIPASGTAKVNEQNIEIDGKAVAFQTYMLLDANGNGTNYVKLRDVAHVLNGTKAQFSVDYDGSISLTTGAAYKDNGSEMNTPFSGDRSYTGGAQSIKINGTAMDMTAITLLDDNGGGYNYFKLRDLGKALGFNVGWSKDRGVYIESGKPYAE